MNILDVSYHLHYLLAILRGLRNVYTRLTSDDGMEVRQRLLPYKYSQIASLDPAVWTINASLSV